MTGTAKGGSPESTRHSVILMMGHNGEGVPEPVQVASVSDNLAVGCEPGPGGSHGAQSGHEKQKQG